MRSLPLCQEKKNGTGKAKFAGDGVLILDKPEGLTSHDLVRQVKKTLGGAKVGHCGTLDPFATGVLILLVNGATKLSPFLTNQEKAYRFTVVFGVETDTQDCTGKVVARLHCQPRGELEIRAACDAFTGEIEQRVPDYSAVRVGGQRLYRLARQGVQVTPPVRTVQIKSLSLSGLRWPEADFEVVCSKGTYVRSLGKDLAQYLDCCGHVSQLRRSRSGGFHAEQAVTVKQLDEIVTKGELEQVLITPAQALEGYPEIQVSDLVARRIRQGSILDSKQLLAWDGRWPEGVYKVVDSDSNLVAIVDRKGGPSNGGLEEEITFKTLRVFGTITEAKPRLNSAGRSISL